MQYKIWSERYSAYETRLKAMAQYVHNQGDKLCATMALVPLGKPAKPAHRDDWAQQR